jgi:hypothetical protein
VSQWIKYFVNKSWFHKDNTKNLCVTQKFINKSKDQIPIYDIIGKNKNNPSEYVTQSWDLNKYTSVKATYFGAVPVVKMGSMHFCL